LNVLLCLPMPNVPIGLSVWSKLGCGSSKPFQRA
jgi:hypothetical protein